MDYLHIMCLVLASIQTTKQEERKLKWTLDSSHVLIGNDTVLICHVQGMACVGIRKWFGGQDNKFLCSEEQSVDPEKYQLIKSKGGINFALVIKNFQLYDANCVYTCSCGFDHYMDELRLNETHFIYPPTKSTIINNSFKTTGNFHMQVIIKNIHPLPNCTTKYNFQQEYKCYDEDFPFEDGEMIHSPPNDDNIMSVTLNKTFTVTSYNCTGHLLLTCGIGIYQYDIMNRTIDLCERRETLYIGWRRWGLVCFIATSCMCVLLLVIYMYKIKIAKGTGTNQNGMDEVVKFIEINEYSKVITHKNDNKDLDQISYDGECEENFV